MSEIGSNPFYSMCFNFNSNLKLNNNKSFKVHNFFIFLLLAFFTVAKISNILKLGC